MNKRESIVRKIGELESDNLGLLARMEKSDAHAAKCSKLGISFAETYPDDLTEYKAAAKQYNDNEAEIARLKDELAELPEEDKTAAPEEA